jgi:hypothetical protein
LWSIPQAAPPSVQMLGIKSIPAFIEACACMLCLVPPVEHRDLCEPCDATSYRSRGWVRVELLCFFLRVDGGYRIGERPPIFMFAQPHTIVDDDEGVLYFVATSDKQVLAGQFSCCRMEHQLPDGTTIPCDKVALTHVVEHAHHRKCEALRLAGDLPSWRKTLALRWLYMQGAPDNAFRDGVDGARWRRDHTDPVPAFLQQYGFQHVHDTVELGMTPLHYAAYENDATLVTSLIHARAQLDERDLSPNRQDPHDPHTAGCTPLFIACMQGCAGAATALIAGGADVNTPNGSQTTPLIAAIALKHAQCVEVLLAAKGIDIECRTNHYQFERYRGQTALQIAVVAENVLAVRALKASGANLHARVSEIGPRDIRGLTALEVARARGLRALIEELGEEVLD